MFEEFYEMYEPEEQEVVALINRCIGGRYNNRGWGRFQSEQICRLKIRRMKQRLWRTRTAATIAL